MRPTLADIVPVPSFIDAKYLVRINRAGGGPLRAKTPVRELFAL
jgi:hypothetical protein